MSNSFPRDGRGRGEPYYYSRNNNEQQQPEREQQSPSGGYQDAGLNPRNSIFQQNNVGNAFAQRSGRLYRPVAQQPGQLYYPASPSQFNDNYPRFSPPGPGLENPYVLGTLIAGMAGITLIIIVMVSIWILRDSARKKKRAALIRKTQSNLESAEGDGPGVKGVTPKKAVPHSEVIHELKVQQAEKQKQKHGRFGFYKPKANKKGNILSKKSKNIVIENKSAEMAALPGPEPVCTSEVSGTIIAYEKVVEAGAGPGNSTSRDGAPPVRVLKETFV